MTCDDLLRALDEDEALPTSAAEHLAACASCRDAYERWRAAQQGLRDMRRDEPPPFLHARMMAGVRAAQRAPAQRSWRALWIAPLVATTFVAVTGVWLWRYVSVSETPTASRAKGEASPLQALPSKPESLGYVGHGAAPSTEGLGVSDRAPRQKSARTTEPDASGEKAAAAPRRAPAPAPASAFAPEPPAPTGAVAGGLGEAREQKEVADTPALGLAGRDERAREAEIVVAEDGIALPRAGEEHSALAGRLVGCSLLALHGAGESRAVSLPAGVSPAAGVAWEVSVSAQGEVRLLTDQGRTLAEAGRSKGAGARARRESSVPPELVRILSRLSLPPGQYLLRRAD
jgi:hypothetical protein